MELKEAVKKLEGAKEMKARYEERIKSLRKTLEEKKGELKELGIDSIKEIDQEIAKKTKELKGYIEQIESLEGDFAGIEDADGIQEEAEEDIEDLLDL